MDSIDPTIALLQAQANAGATAAADATQATDPTVAMLQARANNSTSHAPAVATSVAPQFGNNLLENNIAGLKQLAHETGLGARFVAEGAATIPQLAADATTGLMNGGVLAYNKLTGDKVPYAELPSQYASQSLNNMGAAVPQDAAERLAGDVIRPLVGTASTIGAGAQLARNAATPVMQKVGAFLASNPELQVQSGIGGGMASGEAREHGASPGWQTAYGVAGALAAPSTINVMSGLKDAIQPLTDSGRNQMTANLLAKYADNPQSATANMLAAPQYVPGSLPTSGTASGDLGLISLEKNMIQQPQNYFGQRFSDQNTARTDLINGLAGTDSGLQALKDARKLATEPLYAQARQEQINPQSVQPVLSAIDAKVSELGPQSDAGKTLLGMKSDIQAGLPQATTTQTGLLNSSGVPITATTTTPKPLTQMVQTYRETRDALNKDAMQPGAYGATVRSQVSPVNEALGNALEQSSPTFGQAQAMHATMSKPVDQMTNMQVLQKLMTGSSQDVNGNYFFSPAKATQIVKKGEMNTDYSGVVPLQQAISPQQLQGVNAVQQDLARSNLVNQPIVRPPGSNTFSNAASDNLLNSNIAATIASKVPFVSQLYKNVNPVLKDKLAEALLNPNNAGGTGAAQLLPKGVALNAPHTMQSIIANLLNAGKVGAYSGYVNSASQTPR